MNTDFDLLTSRSFCFEVRKGQLIEIPIVEYIYNFNQHIKTLIKAKADPSNQFESLRVKIFETDQEQTIDLDDANLQQSIIIATYLEISEDDMMTQPNSIVVLAHTGDSYMFNVNIFEHEDQSIYLDFCKLIVEAYELKPNHVVHLFLPHWLESNLASAILEIRIDSDQITKMSVIGLNDPRREKIEQLYS